MKQYRRFNEKNDHEGETWAYWLQVDGNELELDKLRQLIEGAEAPENNGGEPSEEPYDSPYTLTDTVIPGFEVDVLVEHADTGTGYTAAHTKLSGTFTCPEQAADIMGLDDLFYKGSIKDFFPKQEDAR